MAHSDKPRFAFNGELPHQELPYMEIRALAMIGAGLLKKHRGDPKAIEKLRNLAVAIDGWRYNLTAKTLGDLCEETAGQPLYDEEAEMAELERTLKERREDSKRWMEELEAKKR